MTTIIVAGTDTGVGKTFVAAALARRLSSEGRSVIALKPVETGCGDRPGPDEDGVVLARASRQSSPRAALVRLRHPVTPALAAEMEGVPLDVDRIAEEVIARGRGFDVSIVEGAGGLLSPITYRSDLVNLARAIDDRAPFVLVASDRLGCLHHVRSALHVLVSEGAACGAIVLSEPAVRDDSTSTNAASLAKVMKSSGVALPVVVAPRAQCAPEEASEQAWVGELARALFPDGAQA